MRGRFARAKAAEDRRSPRRFALAGARSVAPASWRAPAPGALRADEAFRGCAGVSRGRKRRRTAAIQDASRSRGHCRPRQRLGVRQPPGALRADQAFRECAGVSRGRKRRRTAAVQDASRSRRPRWFAPASWGRRQNSAAPALLLVRQALKTKRTCPPHGGDKATALVNRIS